MLLTLANGSAYEGVYANNPSDPASCILRMVQQKPTSHDSTNGTNKRDQQSSMSFARKDITDARVVGGNANKIDTKAQNGKEWHREVRFAPLTFAKAIDRRFERTEIPRTRTVALVESASCNDGSPMLLMLSMEAWKAAYKTQNNPTVVPGISLPRTRDSSA